MAETIDRKEWSARVEKEVENLDLRLAELRMIGATNGKEDNYFLTRDCIRKARTLLQMATFSIYGIDFDEMVFKGENNEQQKTSNTSEAEGK